MLFRSQHADAVREKSASDSKCRNLTDKVAALEREKADLRRQLAAERREANEAVAKGQAAQAEAKLARAEGTWLNEVSNNVAKQAVKDACNAYKSFFKGLVNKPKFKSKKKSKPSFYKSG